MGAVIAAQLRYLDPERVRSALDLLEDLPFPALWIRGDFEVLWSNAAAHRLGHHGSGKCHHGCYGLDAPCTLQRGLPCPKGIAEQTGRAVSVLHSFEGNGAATQELHRIFAVPLSAGGVLELHIPLPAENSLDPVAGCLTRRAFEHKAGALLSAAAGRRAALLAVDVAELDLLARNQGSDGREAMLRWMAGLVGGLLPGQPLNGLWLGNCFVSACITDQPLDARQLADTLRRHLDGKVCGSQRAAALVRLGLWQGHSGERLRELFRHAEHAMFRLLDTRRQTR